MIYAPHWYDLQTLFEKKLGFMTANVQGLSRVRQGLVSSSATVGWAPSSVALLPKPLADARTSSSQGMFLLKALVRFSPRSSALRSRRRPRPSSTTTPTSRLLRRLLDEVELKR